MKTIVEPKNLVNKLLSTHKVDANHNFRLMKYVLRKDCQDGVLLQNGITGQLVLLNEKEKDILETLPCKYDPIMDELIASYFFVDEDFDEYERTLQIRKVLNTIQNREKKGINFYTILPTTACNARCFYCFEAGIKTITMSEETAMDTVNFIKENNKGNKVSIRWFGGEPTVGHKYIDIISKGLSESNIEYNSKMISNGYLFDEDMIDRAVDLWHLKNIQITLDGTEEIYNKVKSYVSVKDNPYIRVLNNIKRLTERNVNVAVRMNVDRHNDQNLKQLLVDLHDIFGKNDHFNAYAWPVFGDCGYDPVHHDSEDNDWLAKKIVEINNLSEEYGYYQGMGTELLNLRSSCCMADNDMTIVIQPDGSLVRCLEQFSENSVVGNVKDGIIYSNLYNSWREQRILEECKDCEYFPRCVKLKNCNTSNLCYEKEKYSSYKDSMLKVYLSKKIKETD